MLPPSTACDEVAADVRVVGVLWREPYSVPGYAEPRRGRGSTTIVVQHDLTSAVVPHDVSRRVALQAVLADAYVLRCRTADPRGVEDDDPAGDEARALADVVRDPVVVDGGVDRPTDRDPDAREWGSVAGRRTREVVGRHVVVFDRGVAISARGAGVHGDEPCAVPRQLVVLDAGPGGVAEQDAFAMVGEGLVVLDLGVGVR